MSQNQKKQEQLYCAHMEEIKFRIMLLLSLIQGKRDFEREDLKYEFAALQFRKILEMIAFSSLVANKEKYAQAHEKFQLHWKAKKILDELNKINPDFYPMPSKININKGTEIHHIETTTANTVGKEKALTREEFIDLYDLCSIILHAGNPYRDDRKIINFKMSIDEWTRKICLLLDKHMVSLVDTKTRWLVALNGEDGKAHVYTLEPINKNTMAV